jgi:hypothetical protein
MPLRRHQSRKPWQSNYQEAEVACRQAMVISADLAVGYATDLLRRSIIVGRAPWPE